MVGSFNEGMCLERLEEAKVVRTASRVKVVPHESDTLIPVKSRVCVGCHLDRDAVFKEQFQSCDTLDCWVEVGWSDKHEYVKIR
jgi:hypothetical protein